jgi:hypothetical protein
VPSPGVRPPFTRSGRAAALTLTLILATALAACGSSDDASPGTTSAKGATTSTAPATPPGLSDPCGRAQDPPGRYDHVVMLLEENRTWTGGRTPGVGLAFSGGKMPFLAGLAKRCTTYADWAETDGTQNSLNQYVGLMSGIRNDATVNDCSPSDTCNSTDDNLFRQLRDAGKTPRSFVDGADAPCSAGTNASKHIPALYFRGGDDAEHCTEEVLPLSQLDPDRLPTLAFIVPDLCHDGHDCPDDQVDAWAKQTLSPILDGASYRKGRTLVVVVYDEDRPVPNLLVAPTAHAGTIKSVAGSHASLLKTMEQLLGVPVLHQGQLPKAISLRASAHI